MAAPKTPDDLIALLRRSNLLDPAQLDTYLTEVDPGQYESPSALCKRLMADGLITRFHTEQLLKGKYRGFFLGKHRVLDRIGLGGMGQVFLAEHVSMKRRVAIKVLPPDRAENHYSKERFLREARAAGQLDHPNLVRAFDVDQDGDVYFLVMELVDGVSLHDLVSRFGALTPARAAYYLWQVAHGLAYLNARGLVHRDIKPANILVDRMGVVKILDLGLVRSELETDELTRGEGVKILGTADYLAPEQAIDCSAVDIRADIYGLGATGYFLLTGKPPFEGDKISTKLIAHQTKAIRPVHEIRPEIPVELSAVISKMLAKRPEDRYQTPAELAAALESWAENPPPPPTDQEIPTIGGLGAGSSSLISLGGTPARPRSGLSSVGSASGSAIRYHSGRHPQVASHRPGVATAPEVDQTPLPAQLLTLTPLPRPPKPEPVRPARPTEPAPVLPPVLPAAATHVLKGGTMEREVPDLVQLRPQPRRRERPEVGPARRQIGLTVAVAITLAVAAFAAGLLAW